MQLRARTLAPDRTLGDAHVDVGVILMRLGRGLLAGVFEVAARAQLARLVGLLIGVRAIGALFARLLAAPHAAREGGQAVAVGGADLGAGALLRFASRLFRAFGDAGLFRAAHAAVVGGELLQITHWWSPCETENCSGLLFDAQALAHEVGDFLGGLEDVGFGLLVAVGRLRVLGRVAALDLVAVLRRPDGDALGLFFGLAALLALLFAAPHAARVGGVLLRISRHRSSCGKGVEMCKSPGAFPALAGRDPGLLRQCRIGETSLTKAGLDLLCEFRARPR